MFIIAGLGNPGRRYQHTRHNLGFLFLDYIGIRQREDSRFQTRLNYAWRKTCLFGTDVVLVKPTTYMNRSGFAIRDVLDSLGAQLDNLLICYDDLDLPVGSIRIRNRGSAGGHKGIQHILNVMGSDEFLRIRFGIHGEHRQHKDTVDYVLDHIPKSEQELIESAFEDAYNALHLLLTEKDIEKAMQQFNKRI